MKTLAVFCLGTDHERDEQWSLMRALFDLTKSVEMSPESSGADDVKVIFDGPSIFVSSNKTLDTNSRAAIAFIKSHRPDTVCLFGHSRGAVLATMIASRIYADPEWSVTKNFHLWLLDIVAHTHALGGRPIISASEALTAYPNVKEIERIVMEDEWNPPGVFPLEDFHISDGKRNETRTLDHDPAQKTVKVTLLRMPGAHGNGTQVNPVAAVGDVLDGRSVLEADAGSLWPMGEVCLIHGLDALARWNVPLQAKAADFTGDRRLLDAYSRIRMQNARRADGKILLNDVKASRAGGPQQMAYHGGERDESALAKYGEDLQHNALIVNTRHRNVLARLYGENVAAAAQRAGRTEPRELATTVPPARDDTAIGAAIDTMRREQPTAYAAFVLAGATYGGAPLGNRTRVQS